jgi:hypothetical protein
VDDPGIDAPGAEPQEPDRSREGEAAGAGAPRIEEQGPAETRAVGAMGVAEDDDVGGGGLHQGSLRRPELVQLPEDVAEQDAAAGEALDALDWEAAEVVVVPLDGVDRRDRLQGADHLHRPDVSGVQDRLHPPEEAGNGRIEPPVSVGHDPETHRVTRCHPIRRSRWSRREGSGPVPGPTVARGALWAPARRR